MIQIRSMVAEGELAAEGAWGRSMKCAEHYESDILFFFEGKPEALAQIDDELLDWMQEAWAFAESKG